MTEMPKVPKIVYDRLQAAQPVEQDGPKPAHPDADLLTAFAEQALSATERNGVLEHLAVCGDCRELIALALPDADLASAPIADQTDAIRALTSSAETPAPRKLSFSWPSLRWAALAAGVVVAASVLLMRPGKLNQTTSPVRPQVATTAESVPGRQIASSSNAPSQNASPPMNQSVFSTKTDERRPKSELQLSTKPKPATPLPHAGSEMLLAGTKKEAAQPDKLAPAPTASAGALAFDASASRAANETVEVSGAAATVETEPSTDSNLMARNEAPAIEKAKPAPPGTGVYGQQKAELSAVPTPAPSRARNATSAAKMASPAMAFPVSSALARHVTWAIAAGTLQRSLDSGQSWQSALRPDHPLLCYATHGADVWTGGQAGTLFHSADSGITWVQVHPAVKGQQLSADVTHIDVDINVPGTAEVIVSTSNNETWSSTDSGTTWEKK